MDLEAIGYVTHVRCRQCSEEFPVFTFCADTDMATSGLGALTRTDNRDLAIVRLKPHESPAAFQKRAKLPYCFSRLSVVEKAHGPMGVSFQEFLKSYHPAVVIYSCIFCTGTADPIGKESVPEFESHNKIELLL